MLWSYIIR